MSPIQAVARPGAYPLTKLLNKAGAAMRQLLQRVVVPVESTEEMSDVWRIYRLTPGAQSRQSGAAGDARRQ